MSIRKYYEIECDFCGSADHHISSDKHWLRLSGWIVSSSGHFCCQECYARYKAVHKVYKTGFCPAACLDLKSGMTAYGHSVRDLTLEDTGVIFILTGIFKVHEELFYGRWHMDGTYVSPDGFKDSQFNLINIKSSL